MNPSKNRFPSRLVCLSAHSEVQNAEPKLTLGKVWLQHKLERLLVEKDNKNKCQKQTPFKFHRQLVLKTENKASMYKVLNLVESQDSIFPVQNSAYAPAAHGSQ